MRAFRPRIGGLGCSARRWSQRRGQVRLRRRIGDRFVCNEGIRVDPVRRVVRAETGLKLGEFDRETQAFGLATTLGVVPTVGIAGLTLGGGWGNLHAKYGLAIDNVIGADVVTADGQLLTANATENPDLYWGVRGGSGNFGIVTSLEYRLHPV